MNKYSITRQFTTKKKCLAYLKKLRWDGIPTCPYCGVEGRSSEMGDEHRYHCNACNKSYSVTVGTIFENCHIALPKFFSMIAVMLDAKRGISAMQLKRNYDVSYKTAWYAAMRVRCAMVETISDLHGTVEADEAYIGPKKIRAGKAYPKNMAVLSQVEVTRPKRGRGTNKIPVAGLVERDGRVVSEILKNLTGRELLRLLKKYVKEDETTMMTDDFRSYNSFDKYVTRHIINHSKKEYVRGDVHTNTIEGFWSLVKGAIRAHIKVSEKYLPFYLAEFAYKYNRRNSHGIQFEAFLRDAMSEGKCLNYYKPEGDPKKIAYPKQEKPPKAMVDVFSDDIKKHNAEIKLKQFIKEMKAEGYIVSAKKKTIIVTKKKKIIIKKRGI